jgi:hypothetical protein
MLQLPERVGSISEFQACGRDDLLAWQRKQPPQGLAMAVEALIDLAHAHGRLVSEEEQSMITAV